MHNKAAVYHNNWETFSCPALSHAMPFLVDVSKWTPDQLDPLPQFLGTISPLSPEIEQFSFSVIHTFCPQPETVKLDAVEQGKAHNSMHNISGIMHKLSTHGPNGWPKTVAVIKRRYRELQEPLQSTPLFLHAISINSPNSILTSMIELIHKDKGPSFMCKGESGKPKITKAGTPMIV